MESERQRLGERRGCPVEGEEKKSKGAVWFVFGWEEDQRFWGVVDENGASGVPESKVSVPAK